MKSQAFAVVEPSNYVWLTSFLIKYLISMELNKNLSIWNIVANRWGNDTRLPFNLNAA